jgi:TP901 family phage tail tape measure protein
MAYTVPAIFKAIDKMSAPLRKMELATMSLADRANYNMYRAERSFNKAGEAAFATGRKTGAAGIAMAIPLGLAAKAAVDFEDKMADVAKVAGVSLGSDEFNSLAEQAKKLGIFLGVDATEAAGLMQNLAQGGVAIKDLDQVSRIAGKVGVAFGVSADIAGEAFIKTQNALGGTIETTEKLMDTINYLGNTMAASSEQILTFMASGGSGVARAAGASGDAVAAMGASLIAMGKSAEESGTVMERFIKTALMSKDLRPVFDKAGGGSAGMMAIIEKGAKLSGAAQDAYFQQFGQYGLTIQLLAKNFDGLQKTVSNATNATNTSGSVMQEFENRTNTTAFKLGQMKSQAMTLAIGLGTTLLPIINDIVKSATPVIEKFTAWVSANKPLVTTIAKLAVGLTGAMFVISGLSFAFGALTKTIYLAKGVMALYNIGLGITNALQGASAFTVMGNTVAYKAYRATVVVTTYAQKALNMAMTASPIGVMIAGIAALSLAAYGLYKAFSKVSTEQQVMNDIQERALEKSIDQRVEVTSLFIALKNAEKGTSAYNDILKKIDAIQPGIVDKYKLQEKSLYAIAEAEKELTKNIMKRAEEEARAELLKEAIREKIRLQTEGPTTFQKLTGLFNEDATKALQQADIAEQESRINVLTKMMYGSGMQPTKDIVSPATDNQAALSQMIEKENNANVTIGFENAPEGMTVKTDNKSVTPNLQTTASRRK